MIALSILWAATVIHRNTKSTTASGRQVQFSRDVAFRVRKRDRISDAQL